MSNFAIGNDASKPIQVNKKYTGVIPFTIIGINPTKEQISKIYGGADVKEPEYLITKQDGTKQTKIDIYLKSFVDDNNPYDFITKVTYFISANPYVNKDNSKLQVTNKYGEFGWVSTEEFKSKLPAGYMVNQGFIMPYFDRPAFIGEEDIIKLIIAYLSIDGTKRYDKATGKYVIKEELSKSLASFEAKDFIKLAEGNASVLDNILRNQPNNKIKFPVVIRQSDGKEYQEVLGRFPIKYRASKFDSVRTTIEKDFKEGRLEGRILPQDPQWKPMEYVVRPTNVSSTAPQYGTAPTNTTGGAETDDLPF